MVIGQKLSNWYRNQKERGAYTVTSGIMLIIYGIAQVAVAFIKHSGQFDGARILFTVLFFTGGFFCLAISGPQKASP